ncbi:PDZ domain [Plasmopara halstedii]|uniref:PDZ domain n=1 Tax=Plasmopara halstedii TaxID=4781 RepID=A0A0P1AEJ9_PLAHL|nr:PDZ domain [Plasmopara halstedii]CEG38975.1 PDZ domain [Plasmopara halstedii]|eukprot:XP_024575344.1 PDZ domain [Plasmopara halstedii]
MSLKRSQNSIEECSTSTSLSTRNSRTRSKSHRNRRVYQGPTSSISSSSTSWCEISLPLASAPRTVEIMWSGLTAPGFTLKRKRTGNILVSTVTQETQVATSLKIGSELRLVGGFPVNSLTLQDVKKVMLLAPKPVSLVFINSEDVVIENVSMTNEIGQVSSMQSRPSTSISSASTSWFSLRRSMSLNTNYRHQDHTEESEIEISTISAPVFYYKRSENNESKKRKVSKLQIALDRFNRLLNRPVRQASLHSCAGKSIVV